MVAEFALRAASRDPRFPPLDAAELAGCEIEISVLTAPQPLEEPAEIEIGRDGLILEMRRAAGPAAPAGRHRVGLRPRRFLAEVSRKAGLDRSRAPGGTFQAEVFAEGVGNRQKKIVDPRRPAPPPPPRKTPKRPQPPRKAGE